MDKESESWNDTGQRERQRLRNLFANIKHAVRMLLMHADSHPLMPEEPSNHKEVIRRIAMAVEERIRKDFGFDTKTVITICGVTKHETTKELKKTLKLPVNAPEDAQKFFKSDQTASQKLQADNPRFSP